MNKHLRSANPLEARFASIALTLYRSYRNPSAHNFDDFKCTLDEARLFVQGIHVLAELATTLIAIKKH